MYSKITDYVQQLTVRSNLVLPCHLSSIAWITWEQDACLLILTKSNNPHWFTVCYTNLTQKKLFIQTLLTIFSNSLLGLSIPLTYKETNPLPNSSP